MYPRERGAALIFVLLIISVLSIIAVQINEQLRFNVKRLDNQRQNGQAYWYSVGGEQLARALLEQIEKDKPVHLAQPWATEDAVFPIEGGVLQGRVVDAQACFNLNNLLVVRNPGEAPPAETVYEKQFTALLASLGFDAVRAMQLRDRIQDWLDADFQVNGLYGAEDLDYSDRDLAFQSANGLMAAVSELNLLVQLKPEELDALSNLLCVVPETATKININTLKPEQAPLLVILLNGVLSEEAATQLLQQRPEQGWESVAQFLEDPALAGKTLPEDYRDKLAVQSTFFRATINVLYYDTQFSLQSLMEVQDKKSRVLSRRYGELF
ncbi:type II secretion system minor pseudopilin GspK [Litorivivens sp.]|uniref:type II secretion system minor pseudopilin GspK n=3 Tax=Litorivivens sp. TaxID=2020868 RepID=UPI0035661F29